MKAADYGMNTNVTSAFVSTNSICQGQQVPIIWPLIFDTGNTINFGYTSFKWSNLASHNAGVMVIIVSLTTASSSTRSIFSIDKERNVTEKKVDNINAYLVPSKNIIINKSSAPLAELNEMSFGNKPVDGGYLLLTRSELDGLRLTAKQRERFIRRIYGSAEFIRGQERYCLWIEDECLEEAMRMEPLRRRIEGVRKMRLASRDKGPNKLAKRAHQMREMRIGKRHSIVVPAVSSERRDFLPCGLLTCHETVTNRNFALYDTSLWNMALIVSRLHWVWIATVCGKMKTDFNYSNTLGWNTFPVPALTEKNKLDLNRCAEDILLAREVHFPKTIADLYDPDEMPNNLRQAHEKNDETLERIYIGRRFKNDTERLEKLFKMYTEMTTTEAQS